MICLLVFAEPAVLLLWHAYRQTLMCFESFDHGTRLQVATRDIHVGEELLVDYGESELLPPLPLNGCTQIERTWRVGCD